MNDLTPIATVLSIEDEAEIRLNICTYLEDSGYEMLQAEDGESGLRMFRRHQPDAVLCDLRMPGIDGLEVLSAIRQASPETPVIIVSGMGTLEYAIQALKFGAWDFVTKPIHDMVVVETALEKALERARLLRENRQYREQLEQSNQSLKDALDQLQANEKAGRHIQTQLLPEDGLRSGDFQLRRQLFPSMYLSGDFVDYFEVDEQRLCFYLADVSGHDAAAAFITVMLKVLIGQHREHYQRGSDDLLIHPAELLSEINEYLFQQSLGKYLTMVYGVIDKSTGNLVFSQGGHFPPPLLVTPGGVQALSSRSRPVGLFSGVQFKTQELKLPADCRLMCASDGLLELLPGKNLNDKLDKLADDLEDADDVLAAATARLNLDPDQALPDDVTLLEIAHVPST